MKEMVKAMGNKITFRFPGEFEEQEYVLLCWPLCEYSAKGYNVYDVFTEVVKELISEVKVHINCSDAEVLEQCKYLLSAAGVGIDRIHFTSFADSLHWARDYGPDIVVNENGSRRLVNFSFNSYGMEQDETGELSGKSVKMAAHQAIELGCTDIVSSPIITEGGNKEFNGAGVLLTIEDTEVKKRNPGMSREEIEKSYKELFNVKQVIWLPHGSFEDEDAFDGVLDVVDGENVYRSASANGHIDEICRFVDEKTILLAEITEEQAEASPSMWISKQRLDKAYEVLSKAKTPQGEAFTILRMPTPDAVYFVSRQGDWIHQMWYEQSLEFSFGTTLKDGTPFPKGDIRMQPALSYCNFLICNGVVLGQKYWRPGLSERIKQKDEKAEEILRGIFPQRRIKMIDATAVNILGGGIHCITKNIAKA